LYAPLLSPISVFLTWSPEWYLVILGSSWESNPMSLMVIAQLKALSICSVCTHQLLYEIWEATKI
jgi:hypothetical protein